MFQKTDGTLTRESYSQQERPVRRCRALALLRGGPDEDERTGFETPKVDASRALPGSHLGIVADIDRGRSTQHSFEWRTSNDA